MINHDYIAQTVGKLLKIFPDSYTLGSDEDVEEYFRNDISEGAYRNISIIQDGKPVEFPDPIKDIDAFIKFVIACSDDTHINAVYDILKLDGTWYLLETKGYRGLGIFNIISAAEIEDLEVSDITPYIENYYNDEDLNTRTMR